MVWRNKEDDEERAEQLEYIQFSRVRICVTKLKIDYALMCLFEAMESGDENLQYIHKSELFTYRIALLSAEKALNQELAALKKS